MRLNKWQNKLDIKAVPCVCTSGRTTAVSKQLTYYSQNVKSDCTSDSRDKIYLKTKLLTPVRATGQTKNLPFASQIVIEKMEVSQMRMYKRHDGQFFCLVRTHVSR